MAENGSGSTGAGSSRNVESVNLVSVATTRGVVASEGGKRERDLELAGEATATTGSGGATAGGDLQILTNAMVAAEVAKKPLWVKTKDPVHLGGEGKFPLKKQPYHMVPAVIKAWVAFTHQWRWATTTGLPVALISGEGSFGRKLAVLCNSMIKVDGEGRRRRIEPCTVASFNALPRVMPPLAYDAFLGSAHTVMTQLKEFVAQRQGSFKEDGGGASRVVMKKNLWTGSTEFLDEVIQFLKNCVRSRQTDVVHQILLHVELTDDQAEECFSLAMVRPDFEATTKHPDPPLSTMQEQVLMGLVDPVRQLAIAIKNHHVEFVRKFGTKDTINSVRPYWHSLLHEAVFYQNERMVKVLLEKGADVQVCDNNGCTALHRAAQEEDERIVKLLVEEGADVDARDNRGNTALHLAVYANERIVKVLLEEGADVHARTNDGRTAMMNAKVMKHKDKKQAIIPLLAAAEKQEVA